MIVTINVQYQDKTVEKVVGAVVDNGMSLKCLSFLFAILCQSLKQTEGFGGKIKISLLSCSIVCKIILRVFFSWVGKDQ